MIKLFRICFLLLAVIGFCALTQAADFYWTGQGVTADFSDPANWGGTFPGIGDIAHMVPYPNGAPTTSTYSVSVITAPPNDIGQLLMGGGGDVTLNDSAFAVTAHSWVVVGWGGGTGRMNLSGTSGFTHQNDGNLQIGEGAGTTGFVTVTDTATLTSTAGNLFTGYNGGTGTLTVTGNATVTSTSGIIGVGFNNSNNGAGTDPLYAGTGTLNVSGSATVNNNNSDIQIGFGVGSVGYLNISDTAHVNNNQYWTIIGRNGGTGHVTQTGGTLTTIATAYDGVINIGEDNSTGDWMMTGGSIECGGGHFAIGAGPGGTGTMSVTGNSSIHLSRGEFWVGSGWNSDGRVATGTLTVGNGSDNPTITVDNNWIAVGRDGADGTVTFNSGTITKSGTNGNLTLGGWHVNGTHGATWTQNGGALNVSTDIICGENGNAVFHLNGGSVKANMIYRLGGAVSEFHFNGGSVELTGSGTRDDGTGKLIPDNIENVGFNYIESGGANIFLHNDVTFTTGFQAGTTAGGGLTKSGPGNMFVVGLPIFQGSPPVNSYTGLTHVTGGGLVLQDGAVLSSDVTVESTAKLLAGVGIIGFDTGGNVTLNKGVTLSPGKIGDVGVLQIAKSLSFDTNTLNINVNGLTSQVLVQDIYGVYGTVSAAGTTIVAPTLVGSSFSAGTYEIVQYGSLTSGSLSNFVLALDTVGTLDAALQMTDHSGVYKSLDLVLTASTNEWSGTSGGAYSTAGNWYDGTVHGKIPNGTGAKAVFGSVYGTGGTVNLDIDATVGKIVFDNGNPSQSYLISSTTGKKFTFVPSVLNAAINDVNGSHEIAVGMVITKPLVVSVTNSTDTLTLSGAIGETSGPNSLTKTGSGSLILTGANTYTGATIFSTGTLSINTLAPAGSASSIGAAPADAANFQIGNAVLNYTGGTTATDRGMTVTGPLTLNLQNATPPTVTLSGNIVNSTSGLITLNTGTSGTLAFSGSLANTGGPLVTTGTGTVTFTAPGAVTMAGGGMLVSTGTAVFDGGANAVYNANGSYATTDWSIGLCAGYSGTTAALTLKSGTLNIPNSQFAVGYGNGSTGTLTVSGGTLNVSNGEFCIGNNGGTGTLIQTGGTINTNNWTAIGRHWPPTLGGGTTATYTMSGGVLNKTGGGDMEIGQRGQLSADNDDGTLVGTEGHGNLDMTNNANINIINGWVGIGVGPGANGKVTIKDTALLYVRDGNIMVGKNGGKGELDLTAGTITSNEIWVGQYFSNPTAGRIASTGVFNMDGGVANVKGWYVVGRDRGAGTVNMNGGVVNRNLSGAWGNVLIGSLGGTGTFNMNGGTFYSNSQLGLGEDSGTDLGNATFNLNGGTMQASAIRQYSNDATGNLNFNGGVLQVCDTTGNGDTNQVGASPIWLHSHFIATTAATVQANGAKIDTNGYTIGINQSLVSGAAADGGLTKQGSGSLYMAAAPTYNGGTKVTNGSLVLDRSSLPGPVNVSAGATLRMSNPSGLSGSYYNALPPSGLGGGNSVKLTDLNAMMGAAGTPALIENSRTAGSFFDFGSSGQYFPAGYNAGHENFTVVWTGTFHAAVAGVYNFATASDDGSMIYIDNVDTAVVNNNYWQGVTRRTGSVTLTAGDHPITIAFYQGGGGYGMWSEVQVPGQQWQYIANDMLSSTDPLSAQAFSIGSLSGAGTVDLGGALNTLTVNQTTNDVLSGPLTGEGSLVKSGPATLMLTGPVTYTGTTTISDGTLVLNNHATTTLTTISGVGNLTVASGSTLNATSIQVGTLTIGGTFATVPEPGTLAMLALAGLAMVGVYFRRKS